MVKQRSDSQKHIDRHINKKTTQICERKDIHALTTLAYVSTLLRITPYHLANPKQFLAFPRFRSKWRVKAKLETQFAFYNKTVGTFQFFKDKRNIKY